MDVRNFTAFAERASAPEVVATLNRLWERVVPVIHAHGGHVDKFVGDGLLAVFGAPRRQAHHADEALAAARAIERAAREDFAGTLEIGIGLNSGTVLAGNVGGGGRFEFSVFSPFTSRLRASQVKKRWLTPWKAPAPWPLIAAACTGVAVDVPEADLPRRARMNAVAAVRIEHVNPPVPSTPISSSR